MSCKLCGAKGANVLTCPFNSSATIVNVKEHNTKLLLPDVPTHDPALQHMLLQMPSVVTCKSCHRIIQDKGTICAKCCLDLLA